MFAIALAAVALSAGHTEVSDVLTTDDLVSIVRTVQNHRPADRFAAPFDQSQWAGRRFRVEVAVPDHELIGWSYDANRGEITVRSEAWMFIPSHYLPREAFGGHDSNLQARPFYERRRDGSGYVGTTAFGARTRVQERYETTYAMVELWPYHWPISTGTLEHTWTATPEQARSTTSDLKIAVAGHLEPRGGDVVACYEHLTEATIYNARETFQRNCVVSIVAETMELIDGTTGEVLKTVARDIQEPASAASDALK